MAKVQKTLMVPEDLYRLTQAIEEKRGTSFAHIVVTALLFYLFSRYRDEENGLRGGAHPDWMRAAVMLERGDLTVPDIPEALINDTIEMAEKLIAADMQPKFAKRILTLTKEKRRVWNNGVTDFGGKMEAIIDFLVD